jgi:protein TonB
MRADSGELRSVEAMSQLMVGQLDVSYEGTLAQWETALHRRSLLPDTLAAVGLSKSPLWTLQTGRFTSSVPSDILLLNEKSLLTLVMGFGVDGNHTVWDARGVWWHQDDRRDAAVGLWRRERPPATAKLELRNGFESIRSRRPPYDGTFVRKTAETVSASMVIDVPGKAPGTVSSDIEYGLSLHLVGYPSLFEADRSLRRLAEATHVIEHGLGHDVVATKETSPLDQAFAILESQMRAKVDETNARIGKDLRGKSLEDDMHDLLQQMKSDVAMTPSSEGSREQYVMTETQRASWLDTYWTSYPQLQRNRDMWAEFLLKNHLPSITPHGPAVAKAEEALLSALARPPSADWVEREHELQQAYVKERSDYVNSHAPDKNQLPPRTPRRTRCPPTAATTSGGTAPKYLRSARPLEEMYPMESRRLGEEGTVLAALDISDTGCITAKSIVGWSGSDLLDAAVLDWLETVEFIPAGVDGHALATTEIMPIVFKLASD